MERIEGIIKVLLEEGCYQENGRYYGIYDVDIYKKELRTILNNSYDVYINSFGFAVFRSVLYNWGIGDSLENDFNKYTFIVKNKNINELRNAAIFLPQQMAVKSKKESLVSEFEKFIQCKSLPFIINSFHYSSYGSILNYLLYHDFEVVCLASQKFVDKYKCKAEACSEVMNRLFNLKSRVKFVCANDFDSLIQLGLSVNTSSLTSKKVILLFMDGNVGCHSGLNPDNLVNVNFYGKNIAVRKGSVFFAKILNLPIFNILVDSNDEGELFIDVIDHVSLLDYSVDDFVKHAYFQLEDRLKGENYLKWECWLYIHSWVKKEQQVIDDFMINEDDIVDLNRFTYIRSGKDRYVFDSRYYLSHIVSDNEKDSKVIDGLSLEYILKNIIIKRYEKI